MSQTVRIGICSTYAPRACGLATFAADLESALHATEVVSDVSIITMVDSESAKGSPLPSVIAEIAEGDRSSYVSAARRASALCDVVFVQHEFGIFGGEDGELVLDFLRALTIPSILTLHTVLPTFSPKQASILRSASELSSVITVFTPTARDLLIEQGIAESAGIRVVPHGAPAALFDVDANDARQRLDLEDKFVISTFGLVSPGKGLELAIEAMSRIVASVPSSVLVIAGRTHPGESRRSGENYRSSLVAQVQRLGLEEHVRFIDSFLPVATIADVLAATDVFVTPYVNPEQIVSGALTFAVASGCPVVSTGYLYARDLLASGAGTIVESRSSENFGDAILEYANNDELRGAARLEASRIGEGMRWTSVACEFADMARELLDRRVPNELPLRIVGVDRARFASSNRRTGRGSSVSYSGGATTRIRHRRLSTGQSLSVSTPGLIHLQRLVDTTGIVQHATGVVPLLSSGYCVDDVARLIPVAYRFESDVAWDRVTARSVAFVANAFDPRGDFPANPRGDRMHNFMGFDRSWLDEPYFGDHVGRAALGLASVAGDERYAPVCEPLLRAVFRDLPEQRAIHPVGYTLLAQSAVPWLTTRARMATLISVLTSRLDASSDPSWFWFEDSVRYDAAMLAEALLAGGVAAEDDRAIEYGLRALRWFDGMCEKGDYLRVPGHLGMPRGTTTEGTGDEQPLEALALVRAHARAWEVTGDAWHRNRVLQTHAWFTGRNQLGIALADDDGGCFDGLNAEGPNRNQGAESTLAFVASALTAQKVQGSAIPLGVPSQTLNGASARPSVGQ